MRPGTWEHGIILVEREIQLAIVDKALAEVVEGQSKIILVAGGAGMGKTSLLEELRARISDDWDILWGGCDAMFTPRALGPIHDMAAALGHSLARQLDEGVNPHGLFSAILAEVSGRDRPCLLAIEDVHWADNATLDFLKFLGRRIGAAHAALVLTFRDDEVDGSHPLNAVLGEFPHGRVERVTLDPLTLEGVKQLDPDGTSDCGHIHELTGGNPFFVSELLAGVFDEGDAIPDSVREAVNARLNRLPTDQAEFLESISIVPRPAKSVFLAAIGDDRNEHQLRASLDDGLLVRDVANDIRFRHELARLATLARLSASRQQELHRRAFDRLCKMDEDIPLDWLVHHADGAIAADELLELAPKAAKQAAQLGAHREAAAHLGTALRFIGQAKPEVAAQLYQDWAYEAGLALRIDDEVLDARRHAIAFWKALDRPEKVGENLSGLARLHWYRGESTQANHFANQAVRVLEETEPSAERAMAYSLRSQLHMLNSRMERAIQWGQKALDLAEQFENDEARIHALNNVGTALCFLGRDGGVDMLRESLRLALENGFHEHAARVYTNLSEHAMEFRDFALAEELLDRGIAFDTEYDLDAWTHYLVGRQALLRLEQGRLREAEQIAADVLEQKQLTLLMRLPALTAQALARARMGKDDASRLLRRLLQDAISTDEVQYIVPARLAIVEHAWLEAQPDMAEVHLRELAKTAPEKVHKWTRGHICVWARRFNHVLPDDFDGSLPRPYALEMDGRIGEASEKWIELESPCQAALCLAQEREEVRIESALHKGLEILAPLEAGGIAERLRKIARGHGLSDRMPQKKRGPYASARDHPLGFTAREQEVFALVANGATNVEIAEKLSRSVRTIEHHVSSLIGKAEVQNRVELIVRARNEPDLLGS